MQNVKILKLGGSVLTHKDADSALNKENVYHNARSIREWLRRFDQNRLILVVGGGSYGHPLAQRYDLNAEHANKDALGFLQTTVNMQRLGAAIAGIFHELDIPMMPIAPSALFITSGGRITEANLEPVTRALKRHMVPLLWGDAVFDTLHNCRILSGDQLVPYLCEKLAINDFLFGSDVDGIFDADPGQNPNAQRIPLVTGINFRQVREKLGGSAAQADVTGGMWGKVEEVLAVNLRPITCIIYDATTPENTYRALRGQPVGTTISFDE